MPEFSPESAIALVQEQHDAQGIEVLEARAIQKSRDAFIVTVVTSEQDGEQMAVVTREQLA